MTHKKIYIVILNFNAWQDAIECMESVINSDYKEFQIILIDNFSLNNSEDQFKKWFDGKLDLELENKFFRNKLPVVNNKSLPYVAYTAEHTLERDIAHENEIFSKFIIDNGGKVLKHPIIFVQTGHNLGFAGGNNVVLRNLISSDKDANVLLLNPDTFLEQNALSELVNCTLTSERFLMGMSIKSYANPAKLMSIGGSRIVKPLGIVKDIKSEDDVGELDYIYGGALFTNTHTLRFVGAMPEDYFLYWEETDWCYTAKQAGVSLLSCPQSICYDKVGTSIGRGYLAEYFFTYNSMLFYKKHFKYYQVSLVIFHLVRLTVKLIKFKRAQAKAIFVALKDYFFGKRHEIR